MNIFKNSIIYKLIYKIITGIKNWILESFLFKTVTKEIVEDDKAEQGKLEKLIYLILNFCRNVFNKIKFLKFIEKTIIVKPEIWIAITILITPFISTLPLVYCVAFCCVSMFLKIMFNPNFKFKYSPVNIFVTLFLITYTIAALTSVTLKESIRVAMVVGIFTFFYFVIVNGIETKKQLSKILILITIAATLVSIYGIYQYIAVDVLSKSWVDKTLFEDIKARVYSTFENPNVLGEYLLLTTPIAVSLIFSAKRNIHRILYVISSIIMVITIFLTYSRGCYLGLIGAAGVFVVLLNVKTIILFILGLAAMPFVLPQSIINRFTSIGNTKDTSTSYRISIWQGSIDLIKSYWYKPIGQGEAAFNKVYPMFAQREAGALHSHSFYLQILVETGIIGFILILGMLFRIYQYIFSGIKKVRLFDNKMNMIGLISALTGFLVQSVFDYTWYNYRVVLMFWVIVALIVKSRQFVDEEGNVNDKSFKCN